MNPAPGWYHAQGDAPGTVRLWNGTTWVGFPVADPSQAANDRGVTPFERIRGQVLLRPFAVGAQIALLLVIAVYAMRLYITIRERSYQVAVNKEALLGIDITRDEIDRLILIQTWLWMAAIVCLFFFGIAWMWRAMANLRLWHKRLGSNRKLAHYSPLFLMLELQTHSPRKEEEGAMNPVLAWGWWALFAGAGAVERAIERSSHGDGEAAVSLLAMRIGLISLTTISFVLAMVLVEQITKHQDRRLRPTRAQVELFNKEQALKASFETNAGALATSVSS